MTTLTKTKRIDVDTHFLPRLDFNELRNLIPRNLSETARDMIWREAWRIADPRGVRASLKGTPAPGSDQYGEDPHRDPAARARAMEGLGFDMQVLIPDGPFMNLYGGNPAGVDPALESRLALCRLYNNTVAEAQRKFSNRFIGSAIVPFGDVEASCEEARRAITDLGLRAVVIPGNWLGKNLDSMELYPFWEVIDANRATLLVHHVPQGCQGAIGDHVPRYPMVGMERMRRLHLGTYLGFGLEYAMAAAALTLGGVVDEFPNLKFCFFEAGGSWLPYAMYGTDRSFLIEPQCSRTQTLPSELMKKHCFTAVEPMERVAELVAAIGSENYFFGTDFPHPEFETFQTTATSIQDRDGLTDQDKENILGGNICRVLGVD